jgi:dienelactone hydrolase
MTSTHLGVYSDLIEAADASRRQPTPENELLACLEFSPWSAEPREPTSDGRWDEDGIRGEKVSWSCGYGPRTEAWIFQDGKNAGQPRPGIVLLHDHGAFKYWGKEKVADGAEGMAPGLAEIREKFYGGRSPAAALARAGFVVLVHDVFLWGSRRVPYTAMPEGDRDMGALLFTEQCRREDAGWRALPEEVRRYNAAANFNENTMAKIAAVLGTNLAGIVNFEDRVALAYLRSRTDLCNGAMACVGLSGGGLRSALLRGTNPELGAAVIVGLMTTYAGLLDRHVPLHTWLLFPPAFSRKHDWPDVVARHFEVPVLVQNNRDDALFSAEGMAAAHTRLEMDFAQAGCGANYLGQFYPGPHKFDLAMQEAAIDWLRQIFGIEGHDASRSPKVSS